MMPSTVISQLMKENDFHGPTMSVSAMCASANAGTDHRQVVARLGHRHRRHPAGHRPLRHPAEPARLQDLGVAVLDTPPLDGCRPFQEGSRGFVGGEAAVAMVLSDQDAGSYATDARRCHDAWTPSTSSPSPPTERARSAASARRSTTSGVDASEIAYLNAHGPGTAQCDAAEARMLDELFPTPHGIFSVKPLVGPLPGGGGAAVEILATIYAYPDRLHPGPAPGRPGPPQAGQRSDAAASRARWSSRRSAWAASIPPWCWANPPDLSGRARGPEGTG